jgi:serine phosphatase RsbU (regulator of sigma subunit)
MSELITQTHDPADAAPNVSGDEAAPSAPRLSLTDFLDTASLQEIQDAFTSVTRLATTIRDADGHAVTAPTDARARAESDLAIDQLLGGDADAEGEQKLVAPIIVEGQPLGSIEVERQIETLGRMSDEDLSSLRKMGASWGLSDEQIEQLLTAADDLFASKRGAAIQFLYLLANSIARLCYDAYHARQRVEELSALYQVSNLIAGQRDLQQVLDTAARAIAQVMKVRGVVIRMIEDSPEGRWLRRRASHGLSDEYVNAGRLLVNRSEMFTHVVHNGEVIEIEDLSRDPRVFFPDLAEHEGLASMLCAGMNYRGQAIGTVQIFTDTTRRFSHFERSLLRAIAQLLASAVENARLDSERRKNQQVINQLHLAADVQRRMMPQRMPQVPPFDIAAKYVPSYDLGGDFYDFVYLEGNLGIAIGDVVGKGVAASLLMASVRSALRAYAQDVYDIDEIIARVNAALVSDTRDSEFATLWYGVLDPNTRRMTYCNAGHDPPLLVRNGKVHQLETGGMIVGIDPQQHYDKGLWDLAPGDLLFLYTDGLPDAMDRQSRRFGRAAVEAALLEVWDDPQVNAAGVVNHVLSAMRRHTGLRRSTDDCTLVAIRVNDRATHKNHEGGGK